MTPRHKGLTIWWLRNDLRSEDNPALSWAAARGNVLAVYILGEDDGCRPLGAASRWWLHQSLKVLGKKIPLVLLRGDAREVLPRLVAAHGADAVCWNRAYTADEVKRDTDVRELMQGMGVEAQSFHGLLLHDPEALVSGTGGSFKVFTPFMKALRSQVRVPPSRVQMKAVRWVRAEGEKLEAWGLVPTAPNWAEGWGKLWQPGEEGAAKRLEKFLRERLKDYDTARDLPARAVTSGLAAHLHFGEISPREIWRLTEAAVRKEPGLEDAAHKFLSEVGWREFCHHLLCHFPQLAEKNWKAAFDAYPWRESAEDLVRWQKGQTGYPFVDAGMRELWATGTMHNRVRMVVASFLIKHLRLDWRLGEAWFWDTLLDADAANNPAGWQWVAGSGADASPYFRIFNPIEQGRKFDPEGTYIRTWCPELKNLADDRLHAPWEAPLLELKAAGVELGKTYPKPMVEHAKARAAALAGYEKVKKKD